LRVSIAETGFRETKKEKYFREHCLFSEILRAAL